MTIVSGLSLGFESSSRTKPTQSILPALIASSLTMGTIGMFQPLVKAESGVEYAAQLVISKAGLSKPQQSQDSSFELLRHAVGQLERIASKYPYQAADVSLMRNLLPLVLTDGSPTPQVGLSGDSEIEIRWLVGEDFLSITSLGEGDFLAMHFVGDQLSKDFDFTQHEMTRSSEVVSFLRSTLMKMAIGVQKRIPLSL